MGANPAVCHSDAGYQAGCHGRAGLEAADGDDLVQGPNSNSEGAGSAAENGTGAVIYRLEGWDDATTTDSDKGGREELGWQLTGQLGARIVPRQLHSSLYTRTVQGC